MKTFRADIFCHIANLLGTTTGTVQAMNALQTQKPIAETPLFNSLQDQLPKIRTWCESNGLDMSVIYIDKTLKPALNGKTTLSAYVDQLEELHRRIQDQLSLEVILRLSPDRTKFYINPRDKWKAVIEVFPAIMSDVDEAGKCFACERFAAAVHHTLMIVEHGLLDLGTKIGVNDPKSGWTAVTNRLSVILKKPETRNPYETANFAALEQLHGTIEGLKNAWRNKVSHAEGALTLLTSDFSPEVAEEILLATRAFMRRLATELPR